MRATFSAIWAVATIAWLIVIVRFAFSDPFYLQLQQMARENQWFFLFGLVATVIIALGPPLAVYGIGAALWRAHDGGVRDSHDGA